MFSPPALKQVREHSDTPVSNEAPLRRVEIARNKHVSLWHYSHSVHAFLRCLKQVRNHFCTPCPKRHDWVQFRVCGQQAPLTSPPPPVMFSSNFEPRSASTSAHRAKRKYAWVELNLRAISLARLAIPLPPRCMLSSDLLKQVHKQSRTPRPTKARLG